MLFTYLKVSLLLSDLWHRLYMKLALNFAETFPACGRKNTIMADFHKVIRQNMLREKIQKFQGRDRVCSVFTSIPVIFIVISDISVFKVFDSGIADGNTICISSDVFENLINPFRWRS